MACRQKKGRIFIVPGSTVTREPGSKFTLEKPVSWTSFAKRLAKKQLKNLMASVTEVCKPMVGNITLLSQRLYKALELHTEVSSFKLRQVKH